MTRLIRWMLLAMACWLVETQPLQAQDLIPLPTLLHSTREQRLLVALSSLQTGSGRESLDWIVQKSVKIVFRDMKTVHKQLKDYDALSWLSNTGEQVILVSDKHRYAPPQALAALIAHESLHGDAQNSLAEETALWHREARVWHELKQSKPSLTQIPAGRHALVDRLNLLERHYLAGTLTQLVQQNAGYRGLPEHSPGY